MHDKSKDSCRGIRFELGFGGKNYHLIDRYERVSKSKLNLFLLLRRGKIPSQSLLCCRSTAKICQNLNLSHRGAGSISRSPKEEDKDRLIDILLNSLLKYEKGHLKEGLHMGQLWILWLVDMPHWWYLWNVVMCWYMVHFWCMFLLCLYPIWNAFTNYKIW